MCRGFGPIISVTKMGDTTAAQENTPLKAMGIYPEAPRSTTGFFAAKTPTQFESWGQARCTSRTRPQSGDAQVLKDDPKANTHFPQGAHSGARSANRQQEIGTARAGDSAFPG